VSKPLTVAIPHRLGKDEALRRLRSGFESVRKNYANLIAIDEEAWIGERLSFRVRSLGQPASGTIDVADDHVLLTVTLPWLLAGLAEKIIPAIRKEGVLMLERK
jgi:hypothetical protein